MADELTVNRDQCMGSGQCTFYAPNTFALDDMDIAVVTDASGDSDDKIQQAIDVCPTHSIMRGAPVSATVADLDSDSLLGDFPEGRRLVGTRCGRCGQTMIGTRVACSSCVSRDVSRVALPATGVLYSFTRLHGLSRTPGGGAGVRALGYVDLAGGVRTLADLREGSVPLRPDMPVELGTDGDDWFFTPAADL